MKIVTLLLVLSVKVKENLELIMGDNSQSNIYLNFDITLEEVSDALNKAKLRKAMGVEEIPNEVLKSSHLRHMLLGLFKFCFDNSIVPSTWHKSIIKPNPKSAKDDPCIPLNYRGISLLSTVYKIYSSILNARLSNFLETTEYLVDEQNGFRKQGMY